MAIPTLPAMLALALFVSAPDVNASGSTAIQTLGQRNIQLVERSPGVQGVFEVLGSGEVRHIQSGVVCPAGLPSLTFWHAEVFSPAEDLGNDVGCDYGREATPGHWESKLTAFIVKARGKSLDDAFLNYRSEVERTYQDAKYLGHAINLPIAEDGETETLQLGELRSAEFDLEIKGVHHRSELIVAVRDGWIIEVRGTFRADALCAGPQSCDEREAANAKLDLASPPLLLTTVLKSLARREATSRPA